MGTIGVAAALLAVIALAVRSVVRKHKKGGCGCGCSGDCGKCGHDA